MTLSYVYGFSTTIDAAEPELLTFHWNLERPASSMIPAGHVHIGRGLLDDPTVIRPGDFHNAHVPTGSIPFASVVRFAITELGVTPLANDWVSILARSEAAFER